MSAGDNTLFKPKSFAIRAPLDTKRKHGRIVNPPRLNQMGGLDKANEPHGHYRNDMNLSKPGNTVSASKK